MKKWFALLIVAAIMVTCTLSAFARNDKYYQESNKSNARPDYHERDDSRYVTHRTAMLLMDAQRSADHRHYSSGLAQAIAHQQRAHELYMKGSYRDAIFFSLRARDLAIQIIQGNKEKPRREFFRDEREERYYQKSPRHEDLDARLDRKNKWRDEDVVHMKFDFDIKE